MEIISTSKAPSAIGPYSQAVEAGGMLFVSGQIPLDPSTGQVVGATVAAQAERAIGSLIAIVKEAGLEIENIVKITVYIRDMGAFAEFNEIYAEMLEGHKPARAVVEVSRLPKDVLVELDAICVK
jgi:2-iminobutanoate/2-iminopropanoate deaminase